MEEVMKQMLMMIENQLVGLIILALVTCLQLLQLQLNTRMTYTNIAIFGRPVSRPSSHVPLPPYT